MPFRSRQKLFFFSAGKIVYYQTVPNPDTGIMESNPVDQQVKLPDCTMTDLAASLKAGVSLEDVSCKLISPDARPLVEKFVKPSKKSTETKSIETKSTETKSEV